MSLINQMLQDIEHRESRAKVVAAQPAWAHGDWPRQASVFWRNALLVFLAMACGVTFALLLWRTPSNPAMPPTVSVAVGVPVATASSTAPASAAAALAVVPSPARATAFAASAAVPVARPLPVAPMAVASMPTARVPVVAMAVPVAVVARPAAAQVVARPAAVPAPESRPATPPASQAGGAATQARDSASSRAEKVFQQALVESKGSQPEQAQKLLREALEIRPQHVQARLLLARLLVQGKQAGAAAELLSDGLMLLPKQSSFILALAPLWMQAGQQDDAMALLSQGARSPGNDPQYHAYYASQLLGLKRHADAAAQYRMALGGEPGVADWQIGLGLALQGAGNNKDALDAFQRVYDTGNLPSQKRELVAQMIMGLKARVGP